ncbi:MAG: aromatic amino acid ammonia-lyase [Fibrobacteraceae bacterium]|nr:aromatic amino acid ammonia-lyase [Fibrobacteraceae bacterium]
MKKIIEIGKDRLTIEDVVAVAKRQSSVKLSKDKEFVQKIDGGAAFLDKVLAEVGGVYGVTTGYGDSCTQVLSPEHYSDLPVHLTRYHGCGLGDFFDEETTRAIILVRLNTLAQGFSGVSYELLNRLTLLLEHDILPLIPEEGSVGASGDLTPLSYVAGTLIGEREVLYKGERRQAKDVLSGLGIPAYSFRPKEAIAIMNGTAVMNAIACMAYSRAEYLSDLACRITAMMVIGLKGNDYHFYKRLFEAKPHPGLMLAAEKIRIALAIDSKHGVVPEKIQDAYSLRCAPHVIGMFYDAAPLFRQMIEIEMNSANDNPLVDPETKSIFHGGHFYGGHICFAMDSLKNIIANTADLLDRQLAMIVDVKFNRGLPANLTGSGDKISYNHGFKAIQIAASAWTAEALHLTMPMSVFSRSTECHNQDKVSMGTIAARDCIRILELSEQVTVATLFAVTQALRIRLEQGDISKERMIGVQKTFDQTDKVSPKLVEDRIMDRELREGLKLMREKYWEL